MARPHRRICGRAGHGVCTLALVHGSDGQGRGFTCRLACQTISCFPPFFTSKTPELGASYLNWAFSSGAPPVMSTTIFSGPAAFSSCRQRSAVRLRRRMGAAVWCREGARECSLVVAALFCLTHLPPLVSSHAPGHGLTWPYSSPLTPASSPMLLRPPHLSIISLRLRSPFPSSLATAATPPPPMLYMLHYLSIISLRFGELSTWQWLHAWLQ